jgi:hypothetical protein
MRRHVALALSAAAIFVLAAATVVSASSHVRIVRLSSVEGQVQMDRATGSGMERAILNTPVVEGMRLVTGSDGLAEIEFENQSALRLTHDSEVKFSQLLMNDSGTKINQVQVVRGLVYLDSTKGDDVYRLLVGDKAFLVRRDTEMRMSVSPQQIQVAVFKGDVQLEQAQPVTVAKRETLTVDNNGANVSKGVEQVRFDGWNKERDSYTSTYAANEGYGGPTRGYGLQDLNYYGNFFYAPGFGYAWQPYGFANAMTSWDPYSNGAWMSYPGMGYAWASAYPWGWLPYHYGSWAFINGTGWAWLPGNNYGGQWYATNFMSVPRVTRAPAGWTAATPPAAMEASGSARPTVFVGKAGTTALSVPGGRIPPNFASLVSARTAPTAERFIKPNAENLTAKRAVFDASENGFGSAHYGVHVFAPRQTRAVTSAADDIASMWGGRSAGGLTNGSGQTNNGTTSHSSSGGSGGSHK